MKSILALVLLATTIAAAPAKAMDDNELYTLLGSEEPCGLHYDQDAIERLINKYFKPDDTSVINMMSSQVSGTKIEVQQMSASTLTAHCVQVRRAAKHYGLIQ
jgi:hypothetical protein